MAVDRIYQFLVYYCPHTKGVIGLLTTRLRTLPQGRRRQEGSLLFRVHCESYNDLTGFEDSFYVRGVSRDQALGNAWHNNGIWLPNNGSFFPSWLPAIPFDLRERDRKVFPYLDDFVGGCTCVEVFGPGQARRQGEKIYRVECHIFTRPFHSRGYCQEEAPDLIWEGKEYWFSADQNRWAEYPAELKPKLHFNLPGDFRKNCRVEEVPWAFFTRCG